MLPLTLGLRLIEVALDPELVPLLGDQLACHLDQGTFAWRAPHPALRKLDAEPAPPAPAGLDGGSGERVEAL